MPYRISKKGRSKRVRVRLHPSCAFETLTVEDGDVDTAVRNLARARASELLRTVPLRVHLIRSTDGVECGGPGLAVERMVVQLAQDAMVEERVEKSV